MNMKITLGSTNEQKREALRIALEKVHRDDTVIQTVRIRSIVDPQPEGLEEAFRGALYRARSAHEQYPNATSVGIESGIVSIQGSVPITLDVAVVVVLPVKGEMVVTTSTGIMLPDECVAQARERGFKLTTVGALIAEKMGTDEYSNPHDPHSIVTNGRISRRDTLVNALVTALVQI